MSPYPEPTNAMPYLIACYALSAISIYGYAVWLCRSRIKVNRYLATINKKA
jgi:hypothetical protein